MALSRVPALPMAFSALTELSVLAADVYVACTRIFRSDVAAAAID